MVQDALHPATADLAHRTSSEQECVLDGDVFLVVIAVGHPELNLLAVEPALVHQAMEGVLVVIMMLADLAQLLSELIRGPGFHRLPLAYWVQKPGFLQKPGF